ncbi:hypothetical protein CPB86DRAFT_785138 [Serendipita vermifera]|nr:hypothetical protein CPB86DRAFT_785138 [Serendipita vermifera]
MPVYRDNSFEELRAQDYDLGHRNAKSFPASVFTTVTVPRSPHAGTNIDQLKDLYKESEKEINTTGVTSGEFTEVVEKDPTTNTTLHYQSLFCIPAYALSSPEELRVQDYRLGHPRYMPDGNVWTTRPPETLTSAPSPAFYMTPSEPLFTRSLTNILITAPRNPFVQ